MGKEQLMGKSFNNPGQFTISNYRICFKLNGVNNQEVSIPFGCLNNWNVDRKNLSIWFMTKDQRYLCVKFSLNDMFFKAECSISKNHKSVNFVIQYALSRPDLIKID